MSDNKIGVVYIGRRESYKDAMYGTSLVFVKGKPHALPKLLADRFLSHPEFAKHDAAIAPEPDEEGKNPTDEALEAAQKEREQQDRETLRLQDVRDQIARMDDKGQLIEFVQTHYRQKMPSNAKIETLRAKATALLDQYGIS